MSASLRRILGTLAVLVVFSLPAAAQSEQELRQENQRLRDDVTRLEQELQAANARIDALMTEIEQLRAGAASSGGTIMLAEEKVSIDETKADASPRALLKAVATSYREAVADLEMGDSDGSRERIAYLQSLERWSGAAEREFRMNIEWMVRVLETRDASRNTVALRLQAIDPQFGTELGEPFVASLPRSRAGELEESGIDATYQIRGTLIPTIVIDPALESAAPFREAAFVGPYAECTFAVDVNTMLQKELEEAPDEGGQPVDR